MKNNPFYDVYIALIERGNLKVPITPEIGIGGLCNAIKYHVGEIYMHYFENMYNPAFEIGSFWGYSGEDYYDKVLELSKKEELEFYESLKFEFTTLRQTLLLLAAEYYETENNADGEEIS